MRAGLISSMFALCVSAASAAAAKNATTATITPAFLRLRIAPPCILSIDVYNGARAVKQSAAERHTPLLQSLLLTADQACSRSDCLTAPPSIFLYVETAKS